MKTKKTFYVFLALFFITLFNNTGYAEDRYSKAHIAVTHILFDYDDSNEFTTFKIRRSGFVDITFAANIPDDLFVKIVQKLKKHPDIKGVLADRGGALCKQF